MPDYVFGARVTLFIECELSEPVGADVPGPSTLEALLEEDIQDAGYDLVKETQINDFYVRQVKEEDEEDPIKEKD